MGERPGLAAKIADIRHRDPQFLANLARYRLLQGLARLHEPGRRTVHAFGEVLPPGQQDFLASRYLHDDRRRQPGVGEMAAPGTAHGPFAGHRLGGGTTLTAKAVRPVPSEKLGCSSRDRQKILGQVAKEHAEPLKGKAVRCRCLGWERGGEAVSPIQATKINGPAGSKVQRAEILHEGEGGSLDGILDQKTLLAKSKPPGRPSSILIGIYF